MEDTEQVHKPGAKALYTWLSVAVLFVALVVPVAQAPFIGTINVFGFQDGTAYWFLAFAIVAALATFARFYRLLPVPGVLVIGTTLYYVYHIEKMKSDIVKTAEGNMFSGLVQGMAATIHLQWGIAVLIIAGVSLIVAGILSHDTETLPQLFAANRLQFIGGGVGVAVLFLVIASLSTILPHAAAQAVSQSTPNTNPFAGLGNGGGGPTTHDTPAPDPKVASMRKAVSVGILEKGFRRANYEEGTYSDKFTAKLQYHNLSSKIIVGFKGLLVFYDQFGERVQGFRVESQDNLRPGHMLEEDLLYDYNQFMHEDQKLRDTPLSKLRVIWQPVRVNFSDGSSLSSDDG